MHVISRGNLRRSESTALFESRGGSQFGASSLLRLELKELRENTDRELRKSQFEIRRLKKSNETKRNAVIELRKSIKAAREEKRSFGSKILTSIMVQGKKTQNNSSRGGNQKQQIQYNLVVGNLIKSIQGKDKITETLTYVNEFQLTKISTFHAKIDSLKADISRNKADYGKELTRMKRKDSQQAKMETIRDSPSIMNLNALDTPTKSMKRGMSKSASCASLFSISYLSTSNVSKASEQTAASRTGENISTTKNIKELRRKSKKSRQRVLELDVELRAIKLSNARISFENRSSLFKLNTEIEKATECLRQSESESCSRKKLFESKKEKSQKYFLQHKIECGLIKNVSSMCKLRLEDCLLTDTFRYDDIVRERLCEIMTMVSSAQIALSDELNTRLLERDKFPNMLQDIEYLGKCDKEISDYVESMNSVVSTKNISFPILQHENIDVTNRSIIEKIILVLQQASVFASSMKSDLEQQSYLFLKDEMIIKENVLTKDGDGIMQVLGCDEPVEHKLLINNGMIKLQQNECILKELEKKESDITLIINNCVHQIKDLVANRNDNCSKVLVAIDKLSKQLEEIVLSGKEKQNHLNQLSQKLADIEQRESLLRSRAQN